MSPRLTTRNSSALHSRPIQEFEGECAGFFEDVVQVFGIPKSVGQIYGLLYASPVPLSFSAIVERLKISKGSASQGLQLLRSLGAINVADSNSQFSTLNSQLAGRIAYVPELSLRRLISGVLRERVAPMAATGVDRLTRLRVLAEQADQTADLSCPTPNPRLPTFVEALRPGRLTSGARSPKNFHVDRIKQLETWRRRLKTVLPLLSAVLGPKNKK